MINMYVLTIIVLFIVFPLTGMAEEGFVNFDMIMQALSANAPEVNAFVKAFGYLMGIFFVVSGIMELKKVGQSQSQGTGGVLNGPLIRIGLGVALIYLPSTLDTLLFTLWGDSEIPQLSYSPATADDPFNGIKTGTYILVQMVGYISFVRGFMILNHSTHQGAQAGTIGKGVFYIIGGILAVNIQATIDVIRNSFGFVYG